MKKNFVVLNFLTFLLIIPSLLEGKDKKFAVGFSLGYACYTEAGIIDSMGFNLGLNIQHYFFRYIGIQAEIDYPFSESVSNYLLSIIFALNNPQENKLSFYLFSGVGIQTFLQETGAGFIGRLGGGVRYKLSELTFLNFRVPITYYRL